MRKIIKITLLLIGIGIILFGALWILLQVDFGIDKSNLIGGILVSTILPLISTLCFIHIFKLLKKNAQNLLKIERTPQQKAWFLNSDYYKKILDETQGKTNFNKFVKICYFVSLPLCIVLGVVTILQSPSAPTWIGYAVYVGVVGAVGCLLLIFIWFQCVRIARKNKRNFESKNAHLFQTCIKCGLENTDIVSQEYFRTTYENKTVKQPASHAQRFDNSGWGGIKSNRYSPKWEVVSTEHIEEIHNGKLELMAIYNIKKTHHEYETIHKCQQCGYEWEYIEDLPNPPNIQPQVNVNIGNYHETKKDLPHLFCAYCGGKNKGESIKCEHCGNGLLKP